MTIKTFWTIFLKIFGLYLIWQTLILLSTFFSTLILLIHEGVFTTLEAIAPTVFGIGFFLFILRYCIFKTDWIIEKFKLEKGFSDELIDINIHRSSLLSISIIVIGGLMLADSLPLIINHIFQYIQESATYKGFKDNRSSPYIVLNLLRIFIGYFMVTDSRLIVNFIERKRKKATIEPELDGEEKDKLE